MKKHLLTGIVFLTITSIVSAGSIANKSVNAITATSHKFFIEERSRKPKKTVSVKKRTNSKKVLSGKKLTKTFTSSHHTATSSRFHKTTHLKKGRKSKFAFEAKVESITVKQNYNLHLTAEDMSFGNNFENNRGKLSWPVDGSISLPYGVYTIDDTKIRGDNPGLLFSTSDNTQPVKAVFDGIVSDVNTKGEITYVCIRHGKYSTVYGNLSAVNVAKGDVVKKDQVIARVGDGYDDDKGELTFLLMVNNDNVDPAPWLNKQ